MAIVKKLKVYSPQTKDGINPVFENVPGEKGMIPKMRISYVGLEAREHIVRLNQKRPQLLQERYEVVEFDNILKKEVNSLEERKEKAAQLQANELEAARAEIEALKAKLASSKEPKAEKAPKEKEPKEPKEGSEAEKAK